MLFLLCLILPLSLIHSITFSLSFSFPVSFSPSQLFSFSQSLSLSLTLILSVSFFPSLILSLFSFPPTPIPMFPGSGYGPSLSHWPGSPTSGTPPTVSPIPPMVSLHPVLRLDLPQPLGMHVRIWGTSFPLCPHFLFSLRRVSTPVPTYTHSPFTFPAFPRSGLSSHLSSSLALPPCPALLPLSSPPLALSSPHPHLFHSPIFPLIHSSPSPSPLHLTALLPLPFSFPPMPPHLSDSVSPFPLSTLLSLFFSSCFLASFSCSLLLSSLQNHLPLIPLSPLYAAPLPVISVSLTSASFSSSLPPLSSPLA